MYQVENTLKETCASVLKQTYQEFELILVDNGSIDRTYEMALEIASTDERIKVLKEPMRGVSYARKRGFLEATGEYVYFMDADDILPYDSLETFAKIIETSHPDIIEGNYHEFAIDTSPEMLQEADEFFKKYVGYDTKNIDHLSEMCAGLWAHIYKRSLIQEKFFVPLQQIEDNLFNYYAFLHADQVLFTYRTVYYLNRMDRRWDTENLSGIQHTVSPHALFGEFVKLFQAYLEHGKLEQYEEDLQTAMAYIFIAIAINIDLMCRREFANQFLARTKNEAYDSKYPYANTYYKEMCSVLDMIQVWDNPYIESKCLDEIEDIYFSSHPGKCLSKERNKNLFQPIYSKKRG